MSDGVDRDDHVMTLMAATLTLPIEERSSYLKLACQGDEELVREISDTIKWEEKMGGFLQTPLLPQQDLQRPLKPGQVVNNRFEIVREIGEGGMGVVYEA